MSSKYWKDKENGKDTAGVAELNKAFDGIAEDIEDIKENGESGELTSRSVFYSLKLTAQVQNDDGTWTYVFDNSENKLNLTNHDKDKYDQGERAYQLIVNNDYAFHRIILTGITENEDTVEATHTSEWHIDLGALINVTPDKEHYIILKDNIGAPCGNYEIASDEKTMNSSVDGMAYGDGATATGLGASALAHSTFVSGEGNVATIRRGTAIGGEMNASFGYGATAMGVYNTATSVASLATGSYGIASGWGSANFGSADNYYNMYKENGEIKSFDEMYADFQDEKTRTKMCIAQTSSTLVGGKKNLAGAVGSTVLGNQNVSMPKAEWSLTLGGKNINRVPNSLVLGVGTDNTDGLINVSNKFKVKDNGDVEANYFYGTGNNMNVYTELADEDCMYLPVGNYEFASYSSDQISANTSQNGAVIGLSKVIDYTDKSTYWHSEFASKDGSVYPNPALSEDFQYVIAIEPTTLDVGISNADPSSYTPLAIRFYPRQENGNLNTRTWWKKVKIKATFSEGYTTEKTFSISESDFKTDDYGYYYDFIMGSPSTFGALSISVNKIEITIYETANATSAYPYGTYACAQGIRIGHVEAVKLPKKPVEYDGRLGTMTTLTNMLKDGAYYSAEDVKRLVDGSLSALNDKIAEGGTGTGTFTISGNEIYNADGIKISSRFKSEAGTEQGASIVLGEGANGTVELNGYYILVGDDYGSGVSLCCAGDMGKMYDVVEKYTDGRPQTVFSVICELAEAIDALEERLAALESTAAAKEE